MPRPSLTDLIDRAVARGIITAEQADALRALETEKSRGPPHIEAPRGFNVVSIAYGLGALLVVFAFAWFLFYRWDALGPWGVFVVALVYAALCVGVSSWLA